MKGKDEDRREIVGKREFPRGAGRWMNAAQEYEGTALFYDAHGPGDIE